MSGEHDIQARRGRGGGRLILLAALTLIAVVAVPVVIVISAGPWMTAEATPEPAVPPGNGVLVSAVPEEGIVTWTFGEDQSRVIVPPPAARAEWFALPRFSPDGTKLAFLRVADGSSGGALMVVNADGTDLRALTDVEPGLRGFDWAPSSREIAYTADRGAGWAVLVVGLGPGDRSRSVAQVDGEISFLSSVVWHPRGEQIIARTPGGGIFSVGRGGGNVTELVGRGVDEVDASPDGRALALTMSGRVHVIDLLTGATEQTTIEGREHAAHFSPDGRWLATTRTVEGGLQVFIRAWQATSDEAVGIGPVIAEHLWSRFSPDSTTMIVGSYADFDEAWKIDLANREFEPIAWPGEPPIDWQPVRRWMGGSYVPPRTRPSDERGSSL